jgi:hypothetical protein
LFAVQHSQNEQHRCRRYDRNGNTVWREKVLPDILLEPPGQQITGQSNQKAEESFSEVFDHYFPNSRRFSQNKADILTSSIFLKLTLWYQKWADLVSFFVGTTTDGERNGFTRGAGRFFCNAPRLFRFFRNSKG